MAERGGQKTTESEGKSLTVLARMFFRIIARFYLRIEPVFIACIQSSDRLFLILSWAIIRAFCCCIKPKGLMSCSALRSHL